MAIHDAARNNDRLLSERGFWFSLALYTALFTAAMSAFGGTSPPAGSEFAWTANSAGTLIFGAREPLETGDGYGARLFSYQNDKTRGALTLRSHLAFTSAPGLHPPAPDSPLTARALDPTIADLPPAPTNTPPVSEPFVSGGDSPGITAMQIALAGQNVFVSEGADPVPEPATWFAAALAASAIAWPQRHRLIRSLVRRRRSHANRLSPVIIGSLFIGVVSASANLLQAVPETADFERPAALSLPVAVFDEHLVPDMAFFREVAPQHTFARTPPGASTNLDLGGKQSHTVQGAPGETVVLNLENFAMSGKATLTLEGTATTNFIINVTRQFSLSGSAKIVLSGGVQWNTVLFNVLGRGHPVQLRGHSSLEGRLMAAQRTVKMKNYSVVRGWVTANAIVLRDSAQIIHPPVVSP